METSPVVLRFSNVWAERVAVLVSASILASCGVAVEDVTVQPPSYTYGSGGGYQTSGGYQIAATVRVEEWTMSPSLTSHVGFATLNHNVPMTRSTAGPVYQFSGLWPFSLWDRLSGDACGFEVRHTARARFLGIIPVEDAVTRRIAGNPAWEGVFLSDGLSYGPVALASLTQGQTVTAPRIVGVTRGLLLRNQYSGQTLTIQSIAVLCGTQDCATVANPSVQNIQIPSLPQTLACAVGVYVQAQCTDKAIGEASGGTFVFGTDRGTVNVPFACTPEIGA